MSNDKKFDHTGSSFDSFLEEEGILEETEAVAVKRVLAWQLKQAMEKRRVTKKALAEELKTSRSQVDRLARSAARRRHTRQHHESGQDIGETRARRDRGWKKKHCAG